MALFITLVFNHWSIRSPLKLCCQAASSIGLSERWRSKETRLKFAADRPYSTAMS
jgi:hypothetical protein